MFKFKKGDKVRAVAQSHGWAGVKAGDIGIVDHISIDGLVETYFKISRVITWTSTPECLELVERIASSEPVIPQELKPIVDAVNAGNWGCQKDSVVSLVSAICKTDIKPWID